MAESSVCFERTRSLPFYFHLMLIFRNKSNGLIESRKHLWWGLKERRILMQTRLRAWKNITALSRSHTVYGRSQPQRPRRRWSLERQSGLRFRLAPVRVPYSRASVWHGGDIKKKEKKKKQWTRWGSEMITSTDKKRKQNKKTNNLSPLSSIAGLQCRRSEYSPCRGNNPCSCLRSSTRLFKTPH